MLFDGLRVDPYFDSTPVRRQGRFPSTPRRSRSSADARGPSCLACEAFTTAPACPPPRNRSRPELGVPSPGTFVAFYTVTASNHFDSRVSGEATEVAKNVSCKCFVRSNRHYVLYDFSRGRPIITWPVTSRFQECSRTFRSRLLLEVFQ